jgi:hypothetical protein
VCAEPGADGVADDVATDVGQLVLVFDLSAPEALAEQVAPPAVASVERLGVTAVELLHSGRELGDGRLDDEVVVAGHQAERVHAPVLLAHDEAEEAEKGAAVLGIPVDGDPAGTSRCDVEPAVREEVSRQSGHLLQRREGGPSPASSVKEESRS